MSEAATALARRIGVVGAGVGGLAVAGALARQGDDVGVYESRGAAPENGGMLLLWANGTKALRALDPQLESDVVASGTVVHETEFRSWSGHRLGELPMRKMRERYGADAVLVARRALVELLCAWATGHGAHVHWGAACDGFAEAGPRVRARLRDGTAIGVARASDGLIACDGLRSKTRTQLFGPRPLRNAYYTAWVGISEVDPAEWPYEPGHTVAFLGSGLRFCASTMTSAAPGRRVYWYASEAQSRPDRLEEFRKRRLLSLFETASPAVAGVMAAAIEPYPEAFCIKDCEPSWRWARGPVALLGDAAHACVPDLGQGACQALESAVVMADELGRDFDVPRAFARYARRRMDRTTRVTTMSRITAILSMMHAPGVDLAREAALRALLPGISPGSWIACFSAKIEWHADVQGQDPISKTLGKGRYETRAVIGRGASGEVLRVYDRKAAREVALKRLLRADPNDAFLIKREFRALADVRHPNLVELYDLWAESGTLFYTMELIEGSDFVTYVGGSDGQRDTAGRCGRVTALLPQLASGLTALHSAGVLHRDLKPRNILVETRGDELPRVVLLDFGLLASVAPDRRDQASRRELVGAVAYISPEQLFAGKVSEASDWYAAAVVLYEALRGKLPFEGRPREIATAKRTAAAPRIDDDRTPAWLADLVNGLLAPDAAARPTHRQIVSVLRRAGALSPEEEVAALHNARRGSAWSATKREAEAPFHGREREMQVLAGCLAEASTAGRLVIHVCGESGIGKSELLVRSLDAVERDRKAIVFRGRCHPHESIPYKALDEIVDDLSRHLRLDPSAAREVEASRLGALVRLFPVLARVEALAQRSEEVSQLEPGILRQQGARGLRDLLTAIAAERPVLLWIDDAQWGDADSVEILETLIEPGGRIADRALAVVLSYRPEGYVSSPVVRALSPQQCEEANTACFTLDVRPLEGDDALRLAIELLRSRGIDDPEASGAIVREAGGSPFFIGELARSEEDLGSAVARRHAGPMGVSSVVRRRFERLRGSARQVLEVVALAGAPLPEASALRAAGMDPSAAADVDELERSCLLRTYESAEDRVLQPYHDRIAEAVRETLAVPRQRALHGAIAATLEAQPGTEPELLVFHYRGAEAMALAARHAAAAARRAFDALAFDRAAEMFELAARHSEDGVARGPLWAGHAESLAGAGRGEESARSFETAADLFAENPADAVTALDYRRRAAEQLLKCGQVEGGIARMREVLAVFGERLPETPREAFRSFLWQRVRLLRRGMKFQRRAQQPLPALHVARLDAVWATSISVSMVNPSLSVALSTRHLIDVLDSGDTSRICQALAAEASWRSSFGGRLGRKATAILDTAADLAHELGTPYERAWASMGVGVTHWQMSRFKDAVAPLETALEIYRSECRGVFFEIALSNIYFFGSLALAGEIARLRAAVLEEAAISERRNDRIALHGALLGDSVVAWLADDEADAVLARADEAIAEWPAGAFQTQHYHHLNTTVQAEIYRGNGERAWMRIANAWPQLVRGGYLYLDCAALGLRFLKARAALTAAGTSADKRRHALLGGVAADVRRIERSALGVGPVYAGILRAGLAAAAGDAHGCASALAAARAAADLQRMPLHAAAASIALATVTRDATARDAAVAARTWMAEQTIQDPTRMAAMIVPLSTR